MLSQCYDFPAFRQFVNGWFISSSVWSVSFGLQQFEQLGARHQKFATQCSARLELSALNQPVDAEIVHTKHACCLLDGVSQSFGRGGRFFWFRDGFHTSSFHEIFLSAVNCVGMSETGKSNLAGGVSFSGFMYFPSASTTGALQSISGSRSDTWTLNTEASQTIRKSGTYMEPPSILETPLRLISQPVFCKMSASSSWVQLRW